jgi:glycosyltransferase involved in cell wall biosynthesis
MTYVCAFRGRRDAYQVPIALAEAGLLGQFVTDYYAGNLERKLAPYLPAHAVEKLRARFDPKLPLDKVRPLRVLAVTELAAGRVGISPSSVFRYADPLFGWAAAREAKKTRSNLFLYSSYAPVAFRSRYRHDPEKALFQYHPHHIAEDRILTADASFSTSLGIKFSKSYENIASQGDPFRIETDASWRMSDTIICASTFTKNSLVEAGAPTDRIAVVPYGVEIPEQTLHEGSPLHSSRFTALFVGSGFQRKGLHHLLVAWKRARLPNDARLIIVSRTIDPGLERLLAETPRVEVLRGVSEARLQRLYHESSVFIMPSLAEGFGQVYLEALAAGLPVIGTSNTCLPDLGGHLDGVFTTEPGSIEELIWRIEAMSELAPANQELRQRALRTARKFSWEVFRQQLTMQLQSQTRERPNKA